MTTDTPRVLGSPRATVIVHRMPPPPDRVLRNIPAEAGVHTVVVAARPAPDASTLAGLLAGCLPIGCKVVRLVLSCGARDDLAGELADRLRLTVVAPDGSALLLESGTLFVPAGAWHEYRPSRRTTRLGARLPAPAWQAALNPLPTASSGLALSEVPAGLWLRPAEFAREPLPVAVLAVPADPDRAAVLVGHPDAPPAGPETMDTLLGLPRAIRRRLRLIPYGRDGTRLHEMAERLAVHGADVDVASGALIAPPAGRAAVPPAIGRAPVRWFAEGPAVIDAEPDPAPNDAAAVRDRSLLDVRGAELPPEPVVRVSLAGAAWREAVQNAAPSRAVADRAVADRVVADRVVADQAVVARPPAAGFSPAPVARTMRHPAVSPGRRAPGEHRLVAEVPETVIAPPGPTALPGPVPPGRALPTGVVPVAWEPPPGLGWRPGIAYTSNGMLGGGLATPGTNVVVWSESARPVPRGGGAVLFPPGARFALVEQTGQAVLLREIGDGDPGGPARPAVVRALRRAASARSRDQS